MSKLYLVQSAPVSEANRGDTEDNDIWETVASGNTAEQALEELVTLINDEMLDDVNNWLRVLVQ